MFERPKRHIWSELIRWNTTGFDVFFNFTITLPTRNFWVCDVFLSKVNIEISGMVDEWFGVCFLGEIQASLNLVQNWWFGVGRLVQIETKSGQCLWRSVYQRDDDKAKVMRIWCYPVWSELRGWLLTVPLHPHHLHVNPQRVGGF